VIGAPFASVCPAGYATRALEVLRRVAASGVAYERLELRVDDAGRAGGESRAFVDVLCAPIARADGVVADVYVHVTDVTARVKARELAELSRLRAEGDLRVRENLLAIVSHDLRNPLSAVLMGAKQIELLSDGSDAGVRTRRSAGAIVYAVERMSRLVTDLLDMARVEAGQGLPIELEEIDLAEVAREATTTLAPLAMARRLELTMTSTKKVRARADRERMEQLFSNLLGNAIKFTREGGAVRVTVWSGAREAHVAIADNGVGIAPAQLSQVFQPYWQSGRSPKAGAGLGLAVAQAIVNAHQGRVWLESVLDVGTTVHFTIPAATS
jgi:signal transduction histidine kinase